MSQLSRKWTLRFLIDMDPLGTMSDGWLPRQLRVFPGIMRIKAYAGNSAKAETEVEKKVDAIQVRSWHNLAMAPEWLFSGLSARETLAATIVPTIPVKIAVNKPGGNADLEMLKYLYSSFLSKQTCGNLLELPSVRHTEIMEPGPAAEILVVSIASFARSTEKCGTLAQ